MPGQATGFVTYFLKDRPELSELMSICSSLSMLVSGSLISVVLKIIEYFSVFSKVIKMQSFVKQNLDICDLLHKAQLSSESHRLRRLVRTDVTNLITLMSKWNAARKPRDNAVLRWLVVGPYDQKSWELVCRSILLLICSLVTALSFFWFLQHRSFQDITSRIGVLVLISWAVGFWVGFFLISKAVKKYPYRRIGFIEIGCAIFTAFLGGVEGVSLLSLFYSIWNIIQK